MAITNFISFDLGTTAWEFPSGTGTIVASAARTGTHGLRCTKSGASTQSATFQIHDTDGQLINFSGALTSTTAMFWFKVTSMPGTADELLCKILRTGGYKMSVTVNTDGKLKAYNSAGTLIQTTAAVRVTQGEWHALQILCDGDASAIVQVWIDGDLVIDAIGVNCNANAATRFLLGQDADLNGDDISVDYDDLAFGHTSVPPIGAAKILRPNAAGTTTWQSNGAGATYLAVDDAAPDGDTTFIYDQDGGLEHFENVESTASQGIFGTVHNVKAMLVGRNEPAAQGYEFNLAWKVGTTSEPMNGFTGSSYTTLAIILGDNSPDTGSAWTLAEVDGAQVGCQTIDNGLSIGGMQDGSRVTFMGLVVWHTAPGDREPKDPGGGGEPEPALTTGTTALLSILMGTGRIGG